MDSYPARRVQIIRDPDGEATVAWEGILEADENGWYPVPLPLIAAKDIGVTYTVGWPDG
jgi:hypothetical protein